MPGGWGFKVFAGAVSQQDGPTRLLFPVIYSSTQGEGFWQMTFALNAPPWQPLRRFGIHREDAVAAIWGVSGVGAV